MPTLAFRSRHQQVVLLLQALRDLWRLRHESTTPDADWLVPAATDARPLLAPRPWRLQPPQPEPEPQGLRLKDVCY